MRLGPTLLKMRELDRAEDALTRATDDLDPVRFGTELVECLNLRGMAAAWRGNFDGALELLERSADLAESLENGPGLVFSMAAATLVRWRQGDHDLGQTVQRVRDAAVTLDAEGVMPLVEAVDRVCRGDELDPFPEGLPSLHRAWLRDLTSTDVTSTEPTLDAPLVDLA
jgi:tetratricopeptide (TPR) repeat protein